ncbi:MAG: hypothetical protein J6O40_02455 [Ruminococcus sp.]|nr:hypothetical protein [Ruminococcus sp.]
MNAQFEKYIESLSPELQEKARQCKTKEELNAFIAENEIELPEDALEMVSGGCSYSNDKLDQGDLVDLYCPNCKTQLRYWDMAAGTLAMVIYSRYYCEKCNDGLWYVKNGKLKRW